MCGRYTTTASRETIATQLGVAVARDEGTHRYNVAPSEEVLVIASPKGEPQAELMRWGLVPPWSKDLKSSYKMINARMETAASSPAYRALLPKASRRALQVADGYFEWLKPELAASRVSRSSFRLTVARYSRSRRYGHRRRSTVSGCTASRCSRATLPRTVSHLRSMTACR